MLNTVKGIKKVYTTVLVGIGALICISLVALNVYNMVIRYFTNAAFAYTEDVTVLGMLWMMSLNIGVCWIYREHLTMNIIDGLLKGKGFFILNLFLDLLGIAAGILMIHISKLAYVVNSGFVQSVLGFDESFRYVPIMVGGGLLSVGCLINLVETLLEKGGKKA